MDLTVPKHIQTNYSTPERKKMGEKSLDKKQLQIPLFFFIRPQRMRQAS